MADVQEPPAPDLHRPLLDASAAVIALADELGRGDLAAVIRVAVLRVERPATVACVVGEFKQGKSSLVNAMLGKVICPVDDDLATAAITLVHYGERVQVAVRRREGDQTLTELIQPGDLADWATERGNPHNRRGVDRVDIALPHPLLADGLVVVDTPGMGSMGAGHAASTLAFLPFADGLIFTTDASAELSAPEAEFLARATELCPTVVVALTKIDLYPEWRRVLELDGGHLTALAAPTEVMPLSSVLRTAALTRTDRDLNVLSGFPAMLARIDHEIVGPAKERAAARAHAEVGTCLDQLEAPLQVELSVIADRSSGGATLTALGAATARLDHLRGPGARWNVLVGDRLADLSTDTGYRFRTAMRTCTRDLEDQIENLKSAEAWDNLARDLQTNVAEAVTEVFVAIERGSQSIREAVAELLVEESLALAPLSAGARQFDTSALWSTKMPAGQQPGVLGSLLGGLRGAQSGIVLFGMMGRFLPGAVAGLLATNPITIGIGAVFAGMQFVDSHKRKISQRRQQARAQLRQFVDDVQFEVGNEITAALRDTQRSIRDDFGERITGLLRTYAEAARSAETAMARDQADAAARTNAIQGALSRLGEARVALASSAALG